MIFEGQVNMISVLHARAYAQDNFAFIYIFSMEATFPYIRIFLDQSWYVQSFRFERFAFGTFGCALSLTFLRQHTPCVMKEASGNPIISLLQESFIITSSVIPCQAP